MSTATLAPPADDEYMTAQQVAQFFKISERSIREWTTQGALPAYRVGPGRSVRYRKSDVDALARRTAQ